LIALAAMALAAPGVLAPAAAQTAYPERPIELIVPWGAGGGTDAIARIFGSLLEKELGQPVSVVNRTGGSGVVGHSAIANAPADGYTLGLITSEIAMMHHQGLTELTPADYDFLAVVNGDSSGVMVSADSPYQSLEELAAAIKEQPAGTFKASGTGQGGSWHLGLAGWLISEGIDPNKVSWVPSQGAAAALTDMVAGGVDMVTSSLAEGRALIEAGRVRPLAHMGPERSTLFPDAPTLAEATGSDWTFTGWRALGGPKGLPEDVRQTLIAAIEKAYNSADYQDFMNERGFGILWIPGEEGTAYTAESDEENGRVMREAGLVQQ
jgi:tripartite-type tricarboxylate transporter receptor subunit TctC